jgi:hypothetical protein
MGTSSVTLRLVSLGLALRQSDALTLVLRSTHSSQLSVGLLRFCFFFGGASAWVPVALVVEGSGLVDGCVPSSSIVQRVRRSGSA